MKGEEYKADWLGSVERLMESCKSNPNGFPCGKPSKFLPTEPKSPCILITGGAGFIGSHVAEELLQRGDCVTIVDDVNDFYDVRIKQSTLAMLVGTYGRDRVRLYLGNIRNEKFVQRVFDAESPRYVIHLAGRAGVRPSILNVVTYAKANVEGTINLLEQSRLHHVLNFVYASSSSVYGGSEKQYFHESDEVNQPLSPYAATKVSVELFAFTYHHMYNLNVTGLRFFTVYGPRGRPDMAPYMFIDRVMNNNPIIQFGDGSTSRDYTYIDDIVSGVVGALDSPQGYKIYNLGNGSPIRLHDFISEIEKATNRYANIIMEPLQKGDVPRTCANITNAANDLNYSPKVSIKKGVEETIRWYKRFMFPYDENGVPRTLWKLTADQQWEVLSRVSEVFDVSHPVRLENTDLQYGGQADLHTEEILQKTKNTPEILSVAHNTNYPALGLAFIFGELLILLIYIKMIRR